MRIGLLLLIAIALAGCSSSGRDGPGREVRRPPTIGDDTGSFEKGVAEKYDNEGRPVWKLSVKSGSLSVSDAGAKGSFEEFQGGFYRKGELVGWVQANAGDADATSGIVSCRGGVRFGSKLHRTELVAERLEWRSKQDLLIAAGNVEVRQGDFYLGKCDVVFADTAVGQVWMDAKEAQMTLKTALVPMLGAAVAVMGAQQQVRQYGTVTLSDFTSFRIDLANLDEIAAVCKGKPARLVASEQGVDVSAETIEAVISRQPKGSQSEFVLVKATASGRLRYTLRYVDTALRTAPSAKPTTVTGTAEKAVYDRTAGTLTLSGRVVATIRDPERFEDPGLQNEADECVVTFDPATNRVLSMELTSRSGTGKSTGIPKGGGAKQQ